MRSGASAGGVVRVSRRGEGEWSRGNWYALFPEGKGGARWWPGGFMQEGAEGRRFRRVAAMPVCPPFRDRSRGSREAGVAPPAAGDCRERGCAVVDGGARQFRGVMREDGASRGNWYALFPEGEGGARWWPGGFMQEGAGDGGPAGGCRAGLPAIS